MNDTEFCTHTSGHPISPLPTNPYDEDGYCCWCGNGKWKKHMPECKWADADEAMISTL